MADSIYYAILSIHDGRELYIGRSLTAAAERLTGGTVFGSGPTQDRAINEARMKCGLQPRERICLGCGKPFESGGPQNRFCNACAAKRRDCRYGDERGEKQWNGVVLVTEDR